MTSESTSLLGKLLIAVGIGGMVWYAVSPTPTAVSTPPAGGGGGGGTLPVSGKSSAICPAVSLPAPAAGMGTGFDAMPAEFKPYYMDPLNITPAMLTTLNQEGAAIGAEGYALQAECAGYVDAAKQLYAKAKAIRSWTGS